jgi:hypothetical protein
MTDQSTPKNDLLVRLRRVEGQVKFKRFGQERSSMSTTSLAVKREGPAMMGRR